MHDALKNVSSIIDGQQTRRARYEYTSFGDLLATEGDRAEENKFRFSCEFSDDELGLVYYNYRHLNPADGRWISRDPLMEKDGWNLIAYLHNSPYLKYEILGSMSFYCEDFGMTQTDVMFATANQVAQNLNTQADATQECPKGARTRRVSVEYNDGCTRGFFKAKLQYRLKTQKKGYVPKANGCGAAGSGISKYIPNNYYYFDFEKACNNHDKCYGTCNTNKDSCDSTFHLELKNACYNKKVLWSPVMFILCLEHLSTIYYLAVSFLGKDAYENGQDEACEWKDCPCKK